jgi:hypothetical protein
MRNWRTSALKSIMVPERLVFHGEEVAEFNGSALGIPVHFPARRPSPDLDPEPWALADGH